MESENDPPVDPLLAPGVTPLTDKEMHALVDALRKVEEACAHALTAGGFDETQVMLMKSALQGSLNAKAAFSLWVERVKKDLHFLTEWREQHKPDAVKHPKPPTASRSK